MLLCLESEEPWEGGESTPSCKQQGCLSAREVRSCSGEQGAHGTVKILPWNSTQWGRKGDFQTLRTPKWQLVSFGGSKRFTCVNPVSELELIASLENKRSCRRQRRQEKFLFANTFSFLCSELSTLKSSCFQSLL